MKRAFAILLCCFALFGLFGCGKAEETNYCRVNGATVNFMSASEREKLREPLEKLILEALSARPAVDEAYDEVVLFDSDSPTVIPGISYGLFDVNLDGIPELLVEPYGYSGSSGNTVYAFFDIYSGKNVGVIQSGQDDWCVYLDTSDNSLVILGEYVTRSGWSEQSFYLDALEFDEDKNTCYNRSILFSYHYCINRSFDGKELEKWSSTYYIDGQNVGAEEYLFSYSATRQNYIRIPETELKIIFDDHYYDSDISVEEHTEFIVDALLSTGQAFVEQEK